MMHTPTKSLDASRISTSALSPGGFASPPGNGEFKRSPTFKNTMTLSELIEKLVKQDVPDIDRIHAALAIQYLSLNVDKVSEIVRALCDNAGNVLNTFECIVGLTLRILGDFLGVIHLEHARGDFGTS
jgi:hypothetical protein